MAKTHETENSIQLEFEEFPELRIEIGRVAFVEERGALRLSYHYDVVVGECTATERKILDKLVGDFIITDIEAKLENNSLVYTGGVD